MSRKGSDRKVVTVSAEKVQAGLSGHTNRVLVGAPVSLEKGNHLIEAVIEDAPGATVPDGATSTEWWRE